MAPASAEGGGLFDFSSVTANSTQSTSRIQWIRSAMDATEQARRTGKPLLILVNNRNSPPGQSIESTLVLQPEFKKLTEENYVPLYMDFSDKATADSDFYQAFKDRLNVRGYPTVLVTLPDGVEVMRLSGYKNENEVAYMLKLRESVASSQRAIEARRKRLLPGGYRAWTDKKGVVVYAKLDKADATCCTSRPSGERLSPPLRTASARRTRHGSSPSGPSASQRSRTPRRPTHVLRG